MKVVFSLLMILAISFSEAYCQRIFLAQGKARVKLDDRLSREETIELARHQARQNALENIFGTYISKNAYVDIEEGESSVTIRSDSETKGEWLKTTRESFYEETRKIKNEDGKGRITEIWITCEVEGKVRELTSPLLDLRISSLNCPDPGCATTEFLNGDSFYFYFKSPVDGFLSLYIADQEYVYQVLPYCEMPSAYLHNVPVTADKEYVFFDPESGKDYFEDFPYYLTDELLLDTDKEQDFYKVYAIFSPRSFKKPILEDEITTVGEYITPKNISRKHFEIWVQDNRIFDTEFYYQTLNLRIRK